jgi:hypothetical protein
MTTVRFLCATAVAVARNSLTTLERLVVSRGGNRTPNPQIKSPFEKS